MLWPVRLCSSRARFIASRVTRPPLTNALASGGNDAVTLSGELAAGLGVEGRDRWLLLRPLDRRHRSSGRPATEWRPRRSPDLQRSARAASASSPPSSSTGPTTGTTLGATASAGTDCGIGTSSVGRSGACSANATSARAWSSASLPGADSEELAPAPTAVGHGAPPPNISSIYLSICSGAATHRDEITSEDRTDGVLGEDVIRISGSDDRRAEFPFDGNDAGDGATGLRAGSRPQPIDPVGVKIDELEIALVRHVSDGLDVAHGCFIADFAPTLNRNRRTTMEGSEPTLLRVR